MKFFQLVPSDTHIDFIGRFRMFFVSSIVLCIALCAGMIWKGFNMGIDFTGGTVLNVRFNEATQAERVRGLLNEVGETGASVVSLDVGDFEYLITVRSLTNVSSQDSLAKRLVSKMGEGKIQILKSDIVGPKVGSELRAAALRSIVYAVILIMIYIWFRFDFRFAPGATVAMIHDIIVTAGFYLISGHEFTITSIAALLTIAGYSVNDTIVIYDRVREIIKRGGDDQLPLGPTINRAVNLTLSRTLLTSTVTLVSIIPIMFLTKGEIQSFSLAMCVGIFSGVYSTVYIAAPLTIYAQRLVERRATQVKT